MNTVRLQSLLLAVTRRSDLMLAALLVAVIFMMILPLPLLVVDTLIAMNLGLSAVLLMVAIYLPSPLSLSSFPSLLLITTLFRLSLSISTSRLILIQADAGQIIFTFGNFVIAGNLIVGMVIFMIITIVQFIVITKGTERVAEVGARFTLDAMPGKQMSIDSDMRAGLIDIDEARRRRNVLEKESQLYGSMDGAMKFVKGDAIASLIIVFVNILGGVSIGVLQRGMEAGAALQIYSILTVGDGLISQIPALFISVTAGIIVTRVTQNENSNLGEEIGAQLLGQPRAILIAAVIMVGFALIPGFPSPVFLALGALAGLVGFTLTRKPSAEEPTDAASILTAAAPAGQKPSTRKLTDQEEFAPTVPLILDLAAGLQPHLPLVSLNDELIQVRRALFYDLGVPFPGIHLRFNESLPAESYRILLNEVPVSQGRVRPDWLLVREGGERLAMLDIASEHDKPFLPRIETLWVSMAQKSTLDKIEIPYFEPVRILTFHLSHTLKRYADEFVGIQETRYLLDQMEARMPELVKEVQRVLPVPKIAEILQRLVSEEISIRNLRSILGSLLEWGQKEKDPILLTEYVRGSLKRYITYKHSAGQNILPAYIFEPSVEETVRSGIRQTSAGSYLALDPKVSRKIVDNVKRAAGDFYRRPQRPALITSMDIRRYLRKMIEADLPELPVLSYQELSAEVTVQPIARVNLN
ncbi:Low calcium response locus protein D [Gammaproteobacteria bacterium]